MSDTIDIKLPIKKKDIVDLFITGIEGGYCPWLESVDCAGHYGKLSMLERKGTVFSVTYDDPEKEEGTFTGKKKITMADIVKGLEIMAEKSPYQFGQFLADNCDAITGDVFLQCVILQDIVYG